MQVDKFQAVKSKKGILPSAEEQFQASLPVYKRTSFLKVFLVASFFASFFLVVLPKLSFVMENREQSVIKQIIQEEKEATLKQKQSQQKPQEVVQKE